MPTRLLVIGLDAMDATLIEQWAAAGQMPAFARLEHVATRYRLTNRMRSHPGAIWPELNTGRSVARLGLYYHPEQLHPHEPIPREVEADEIDSSLDWWNIASQAGRRVAVLDVPQSVPMPGVNGIHISDWGSHDRAWARASEPSAALAEARRLVGDHAIPHGRCDGVIASGTKADYDRLLDLLLAGVEQRTRLAEDLLRRQRWDAFNLTVAESHCVGHHFWGVADPTRPVPVVDPPERLSDAVRTVYRAIDSCVARLIVAAGPDARVLVVASHGMGPYVGGYQLIPQVLVRLGLRPRPRALPALLGRLPPSVRAALRRAVPANLRQRRLVMAGTFPQQDLTSPRTRATTLPNNRCAAIRLNLRGREPHGQVEPGGEADALIDELRRELLDLTQPGTGEPIVDLVATPRELFGDGTHPGLPDLTVAFRNDLGPLEACESARVGLLEVPLWSRARRADGWPERLGRIGDHTDASRLWLQEPGVSPGVTAAVGKASVCDVAPTALQMLWVDVPDDIEGRALLPPG